MSNRNKVLKSLRNNFNKYLKEKLNKINPNIEYFCKSYSISFLKY